MADEQKKYSTIPDTTTFRAWVHWAVQKLNLPYSRLMRDDRPSTKNRASSGLGARSIRMDFARELEIELFEHSERLGVDIGTWRDFRTDGVD